MWGGRHADVFVYDGQGNDTIGDFVKGQDVLNLVGTSLQNMVEFEANTVYQGKQAIVSFEGGNSLYIQLDGEENLSVEDILFA